MDDKANIQHNKLMKIENSMLMNGVYNAETLEKLTLCMTYTTPHLPMVDCLQVNIALLYSRPLCIFLRPTTLFYKFTFVFKNNTR